MLRRGVLLLLLAPALALALEDQSALVQQKATAEKATIERHQGVSCRARPEVCHDGVFNCHSKMGEEELNKDITRGTDGHPNPNALCTYKNTKQLSAWKKCIVERNLTEAANMLRTFRIPNLEEDAPYCFGAGHCNNTAVTENTSLEEAEAMCNQIYGKAMWSGIGYEHTQTQRFNHMGRKNPYSHMACAEGRWHCDVMYCRMHICHAPEWRRQYHGLTHWTPGSHWAGVIPADHYRDDAEPSQQKSQKKERKHSVHWKK